MGFERHSLYNGTKCRAICFSIIKSLWLVFIKDVGNHSLILSIDYILYYNITIPHSNTILNNNHRNEMNNKCSKRTAHYCFDFVYFF